MFGKCCCLIFLHFLFVCFCTRLTQLARQYNTLLVVDDTIANFANVDLLHSSGES